MAFSTVAAPTQLRGGAEPMVDPSARVHPFSQVGGDVYVGPNVLIAPGTSIRADEGAPFHIGESSNVQDGVVIHGLEQGRVIGDDQRRYSVWIGQNTSITHMALIHGPAYIGNSCFIGFRSTVFNARVGKGCIVMMHALIQNVEVPPGKYVPSGAVITTQQQADRLPNVQAGDIEFASRVVGVNQALRSGEYGTAGSLRQEVAPAPRSIQHQSNYHLSTSEGVTPLTSTHVQGLSADLSSQVRQLLAQGFQIGTEHADKRRFRANAWHSGAAITATHESGVIAALEACMAEHQGQYVRLVGIDPKAKRRVMEAVIQRPDGRALRSGNGRPVPTPTAAPMANYTTKAAAPELSQTVRQLLAQGFQVGTEHADKRRFRANAWNPCAPIKTMSEAGVIAALEDCMAEHQGQYVRLIGIDKQAKRRVMETIIQRPDGKAASNGRAPTGAVSAPVSGPTMSADVRSQVRQLLAQGLQVGTEHADKRRFRANAWNPCAPIKTMSETGVIAALEACMAEHQGEYIRLIGIDKRAKRRVLETIIQRPGDAAVSNGRAGAPAASEGGMSNGKPQGTVQLDADLSTQVRQLLAQGLQVGTEHADKRRFRANAWNPCAPIKTTSEAGVIAALQACLGEHQGEYVRLIGVDKKAKRRVMETVIQRP